jgi:hypothetical protein
MPRKPDDISGRLLVRSRRSAVQRNPANVIVAGSPVAGVGGVRERPGRVGDGGRVDQREAPAGGQVEGAALVVCHRDVRAGQAGPGS